MEYAICPVKDCRKKFLNKEFLENHIQNEHASYDTSPRQKGWATPYGFIDFTMPVTYEHACKMMKEMSGKNIYGSHD